MKTDIIDDSKGSRLSVATQSGDRAIAREPARKRKRTEAARMKGDHLRTTCIVFLVSRLSTYTVIRSSNKILNMIPVRSKEDPDISEGHVITELGA